MYRLICSEPVVLNLQQVQECTSSEGWILHQVPDPFDPSQLSPETLGSYWAAGFIVYLTWYFVEKPIRSIVNATVEMVKKMNGEY